LADVPTVGEFVPGYEASGWYGIGAPKATPIQIIDKLNKEINAALDDPQLKARLGDIGGTPLLGSPAHFGKMIADETEKWGRVVNCAGARANNRTYRGPTLRSPRPANGGRGVME